MSVAIASGGGVCDDQTGRGLMVERRIDRVTHTAGDAVHSATDMGALWTSFASTSLRQLRASAKVHRADDRAANRDSFFHVNLPISEPDPVSRIRAIRGETSPRKRRHDAEEMDRLLETPGRSAPQPRRACDRFLFGSRRFAVSVSTVKGPSMPVSVLGRSMRRTDIAERHAPRVSTVSLQDQPIFGSRADPPLVEGLHRVAAAVTDDVALLSLATGRHGHGRPGPPAETRLRRRA